MNLLNVCQPKQKKIILFILVLLVSKAHSQVDTIKNFQWTKDNVITCYYKICDTCTEVNRRVNEDSTNMEYYNLKRDLEYAYKRINDTIERVLYQNKSQSLTGYERCWIFYKHSEQLELQFYQLTPELQYEYYLISEKIKKIIFKRGY